jgi:hypothetical protein
VQIGFPYFGRQATVSMNEIDLWLERLYWIAMIFPFAPPRADFLVGGKPAYMSEG